MNNIAYTVIIVAQVVSALAIIGLVLLQQGKGADMGAAFGSGASGSLFGATGSSNFLSKSTAIAAVLFFSATLALAFVGNKPTTGGAGIMDQLPVQTAPAQSAPVPASGVPATVPSAPAAPAASGNTGQANQIPK